MVEPKFIAKMVKNEVKEVDVYQKLRDLKPIENLDIEDFAKHLASKRNNPQEYSGIITGFFKRWRLSRETKAVGLLDEYLQKMRVASDSATQLQETILKNRIMFIFQVQFAQERLQRQWALEKKGYDHQEVLLELNISKAKAFTKFYNEIDLKNLSETALILLNMTTERTSSSTFSTLDTQSSTSVQYGSPEEIMRIKQQEKLMEVVMGEYLQDIKIKSEMARKAKSEADTAEIQTEVNRDTGKKTRRDLADVEATRDSLKR